MEPNRRLASRCPNGDSAPSRDLKSLWESHVYVGSPSVHGNPSVARLVQGGLNPAQHLTQILLLWHVHGTSFIGKAPPTASSYELIGPGEDLEMDLIDVVNTGGEPNSGKEVANLGRRRSVQKLHGCMMGFAVVLHNPHSQATFLLCQVRDHLPEVAMIADSVLVLDHHRTLIPILVNACREDIESLFDNPHLG